MIIRNAFVSNSSSSSFVVAFTHKPKNVEDLKKMLFGKQEWHYAGFYSDNGDDVSTTLISENVFKKIKRKATKKQVYEAIISGWFEDYYTLPGNISPFDDPEYKKLSYNNKEDFEKINDILTKYEKINDKRAKDIANSFIDCNEDKYIVVMSFSDECGESIEEHSGIFQRLEHLRISCH